MKYFPESNADIEVIIKNNRPSKSNICSGYRPAFKVKDDYVTTGIIKFINCDVLSYGEQSVAEFWFITPELYPFQQRSLPRLRQVRFHRHPQVQPDVQDPSGCYRRHRQRGISPSRDRAGHLRKLRKYSENDEKEAPLRRLSDR